MFAGLVFAAAASISFSGVQPQLAAIGERVYLVFGQGDLISVARSSDGGETFSQPSSLPGAGKLALGMHRGPRIAVTSDAVLVAAVAGAKGGGADGDVLLYRSTDRGTTWLAPVAINDVPGSAREGLHALVASPTGVVVVAWLDLRDKGTRIYAAVSRDHGATWAPDALVYASPSGTVCECCHPSVAIGAAGQVAIMFRNSLSGIRDMHLAESREGVTFTPARKLGTGSWALDACPMDGGAISFSADDVVSTWRREGDVFLTTDRRAERPLGAGRDPVVAHFKTNRDVAWSASDGVVLARNETTPLSLGRGRFPSLVALKNKTVIAWEHEGQTVVRAIAR